MTNSIQNHNRHFQFQDGFWTREFFHNESTRSELICLIRFAQSSTNNVLSVRKGFNSHSPLLSQIYGKKLNGLFTDIQLTPNTKFVCLYLSEKKEQ